jgi:hypothetical protein
MEVALTTNDVKGLQAFVPENRKRYGADGCHGCLPCWVVEPEGVRQFASQAVTSVEQC